MKHFLYFLFLASFAIKSWAQPEPFPIDKSFSATTEYLQKQWDGDFSGNDPMASQILMSPVRVAGQRKLVLNTDMTFTNIMNATITKRNATSDLMLLREETGIYEYDKETGIVTYSIKNSNSLNLSLYAQKDEISYVEKEFSDEDPNSKYQEPAQFTYENNGVRQWVIQDSKLGSDQMQGMPAVYVLTGTPIEVSGVSSVSRDNQQYHIYDLSGKLIQSHINNYIIIRNGKKYISK